MNCEKILHLSNCQTTINKPNMKKISLIALLALAACQSNKTETTDSTTVVADTVAAATAQPASEALCFELKDGQDVTAVKLVINGDEVSGEMQWLPWEKDGAIGTLKGKVVDGEIVADYNYEIEGSSQSEEKIFKLDGDKLLIKDGELVEGKDGKLIMKDPAKAQFKETLLKVKCE